MSNLPPTDWGAINAKIAQSTEQATWSTAYATWAGAGTTILATVVAAVGVFFAWKALNSWREQALGEHELGRLLGARQALRDIESLIYQIRSPLRVEGEPDQKTRSNNFRIDISRLHSTFLRETVGLDEVWNASSNYKELGDELHRLISEVALAANLVYEKEPPEASVQQHILVGSRSYRPENLEEHQSQSNIADERIQKTIGNMKSFLVDRLRAYSYSKSVKRNLSGKST
jgi:hypothetical protein